MGFLIAYLTIPDGGVKSCKTNCARQPPERSRIEGGMADDREGGGKGREGRGKGGEKIEKVRRRQKRRMRWLGDLSVVVVVVEEEVVVVIC